MSKQWWKLAALGLVLWAGAVQVRAQEAASAGNQEGAITLQIHDALPEDAFAALGKKSGVRFYTEPNDLWDQAKYQQPVQLNIVKQDFWPALKQLCEVTKLYPSPYQNGGKRIGLQSGERGNIFQGRIFTTNQFMILLDNISTTRNLNMEHPEELGKQQLSLQFQFFADPKLRISRTAGEIRLAELKDENGQTLLPNNYKDRFNNNRGWYDSPREMTFQRSASVNLPDNTGKKISELKGGLEVTVLKKTEKWVIKDIMQAENVTKDFGPCTYTIKRVSKEENGDNYRVEISREGGTSEAEGTPDFVNPTNGNVVLRDTKGHVWRCNSWGGGNQQTWSFYLEQGSNGLAKAGAKPVPEQLSLEIPVEVESIIVPIEFKDIPLP